jgi:hypothetical protein
MPEVRQPMQSVQVNYLCDECGESMTPTGIHQPVSPPRIQHKCIAGHEQWFSGKQYPLMEWVEIETVRMEE